MSARWQEIARATAGDDYAVKYAERFREMVANGEDVHGEAAFVTHRLPAPARVLDAGCGTGRIGIRLHELGYEVVGVDIDPEMLFVAAAEEPELYWLLGDLATVDLEMEFDLVLVAGNTIPLLEDGTLEDACARIAAHAVPGGLVVCGFGLDEAHLPTGCPVTPLADFEDAMTAAGLVHEDHYGTWARGAFDPDAGYVVSVHRRPEE